MSLTLVETRAELVADLRLAGFAVSEHPDQAINAPAVLVVPSSTSDFISEADTFDPAEVTLRLDLYLLPAVAEGAAFIDAVTTGIQRLILAIDDRWKFDGASSPFRASNLAGQIACRIQLATTAHLELDAGGTP